MLKGEFAMMLFNLRDALQSFMIPNDILALCHHLVATWNQTFRLTALRRQRWFVFCSQHPMRQALQEWIGRHAWRQALHERIGKASQGIARAGRQELEGIRWQGIARAGGGAGHALIAGGLWLASLSADQHGPALTLMTLGQ